MQGDDVRAFVRMLGFCDEVEERLSRFQINREAFESDSAYQDVLLVPISQLGELSRKLSDSAISLTGGSAFWRDVRAFRNVFVHDYDGINLDVAWDFVSKDVPSLKLRLIAIPGVKRGYEVSLSDRANPPSDEALDEYFEQEALSSGRELHDARGGQVL